MLMKVLVENLKKKEFKELIIKNLNSSKKVLKLIVLLLFILICLIMIKI